MVGKKKAKCYKKIEVKVWFRRLGNADKYWLESFRDYTSIFGGGCQWFLGRFLIK